MFRSLLHQLYQQSLFARGEILAAYMGKMRDYGEQWEWQIEELKSLLSDILSRMPRFMEVLVFVDALDEAMDGDERAAGKLVSYFHALNDRIEEVGGSVKLCISSRHYPVVSSRAGVEIWIQNENEGDIAKYVHRHLDSEVENWTRKPEEQRLSLEHAIVQKADGVFLWVYLRLRTIIENLNDGFYTIENIQQLLEEESNELFPLYQGILMKVANLRVQFRKKALLFMQWVCLAERPLSVEELRYAMACDKGSVKKGQKRCEDSEDFIKANDTMERLTKSLSGGLAAIRYHEDRSTVQPFHQTVREFFLGGGLQSLASICFDDQSISNKEVIGRSEDRLAKSCINYLKMEDLLDSATISPFGLGEEFLFLHYATKYWPLHAERAESNGVSQRDLIEVFEEYPRAFAGWKDVYQSIKTSQDEKCPPTYSSLIHLAANSNLETLCDALINKGVSVDEQDDYESTPLNLAARWGYLNLVKRLIELGANIEAQDVGRHTALELAASYGHDSVAKLLLQAGSDVNKGTGSTGTALQSAARNGNLRLVKMFVENGADIHNEHGFNGTALQEAIQAGRENVVKYLLDQGADPNASGGYHGFPLQAAVCIPDTPQHNIKFVRLLLDAGANVNAKGGFFGNALQAAVTSKANYDIIQLLLTQGADVNAEGGYFGHPLQASCSRETEEIVNILLKLGADVNAQGGRYHTALQAAAATGCLDLVRMLVDSGADINIHGGFYGSVLEAAASSPSYDVVPFLLERGANIVPGGFYGNVLQAAAYAGNQEAIKVFLEKGIDINEQGGEYGTVLEAAMPNRSFAFIMYLLDCGANVNGGAGQFGNALGAAIFYERKNVVELLLERGADIWLIGQRSHCTGVQAAAIRGKTKMLRILLEKGPVDIHGDWYEEAWDVARRKGHNDVLRLLEEKRAAAI